jgi:hypothetical protein
MLDSGFDRDLYMRAWRFAAERHNGQKMPGSELPYIVHVGAVAMEVIAAIDADKAVNASLAVACALLHDTIEDASVSRDELEALFGADVADGVVALSKNRLLRKDEKMADSLQRIRAQAREVAMVKMADRIVNLEPPPEHWSCAKRRKYREEAELILEALGGASSTLATRLREKIGRYEAYLVATVSDWPIHPMPVAKERFDFYRKFDEQQWKRLLKGYLPEEMEEKWFIYAEGSWINFHRSWTGFCIYRLKVRANNDAGEVVEAWVSRDADQYDGVPPREEAQRLDLVLSGWLGGR